MFGLQAETAAGRINKVLGLNMENQRLMDEYEKLASDVSTNAADGRCERVLI